MKLSGLVVLTGIFSFSVSSQYITVNGEVFAFKDAPLSNIKVIAKNIDSVVLTEEDGSFLITCDKKDKLVFKGKGFQRNIAKVGGCKPLSLKMIFKGGKRVATLAVQNNHISEAVLKSCMIQYYAYNVQFNESINSFYLTHFNKDKWKIISGYGFIHHLNKPFYAGRSVCQFNPFYNKY